MIVVDYNLNYMPTALGVEVEEKLHLGVPEHRTLNVGHPTTLWNFMAC
jgi:hypothetical protein